MRVEEIIRDPLRNPGVRHLDYEISHLPTQGIMLPGSRYGLFRGQDAANLSIPEKKADHGFFFLIRYRS